MYRTRLVREELASLEKVSELTLVEQLMMKLPDCVASPLSVNALREDLQVAHQTVARWLDALERLYAVFRVYPMSSRKLRSLKKEPKHYHFDWTVVPQEGPRFENLIACHLLKWCHFIEDTEGYDMALHYFRDRDQREVDFVVYKSRAPILFVEAKTTETRVSKDLIYLKRKFPEVEAVQVVLHNQRDFRTADNIRVRDAVGFLLDLV